MIYIFSLVLQIIGLCCMTWAYLKLSNINYRLLNQIDELERKNDYLNIELNLRRETRNNLVST